MRNTADHGHKGVEILKFTKVLEVVNRLRNNSYFSDVDKFYNDIGSFFRCRFAQNHALNPARETLKSIEYKKNDSSR